VEIYDDITNYWAPLSPEEARLFQGHARSQGGEEFLGLARGFIKRAPAVLRVGTARIDWGAGEHALLSGAPW
jgi:hypothetical protein